MIDVLMVIGGLALLFFGGEGLLKGSVSLARNFGLSNLLVSAVIVGFGTSMPEMTVSVGAALKGSPEISLGNVVGSNIANILLIVGTGALLSPILIKDKTVRRDVIAMLAASLALCGLALTGAFNFTAGLIMLAGLTGYIVWSYQQDRRNSEEIRHIEEDVEGEPRLSVPLAAIYTVAGLGLLIGGATMLVEGAISLARDFGISEAVIGLTIVAIGTSLPELATSVVASLRKHSDVIIGNILGSNIFNILSILGVTALIKPIPVAEQILNFDIWFMLGTSFLLAPFLWFGWRMGRIAGLAMLAVYAGYIAFLYLGGGI